MSDTDNDGISDGEEILGWFKTNPLSADSDHDFASDSAEVQSYHVAIDDRYDLDEPISISFEVNCERATSAQIAFMITFGEAINEEGKVYGIQDVPDLNVSIVKVDDNLLLFNATTNCTRYYSKVIDIKDIMESNGKDYRGEYMVQINNTEAGCILEQFEIEIAGYLNPNDADFDNDGIMDGVEMGLLVRGTDTIDHNDLYGENATISFPMEETCWWTLDEGTGMTAEDLTFNENDGTLINMESSDWKTGKIGDHALQFDGVDEYIDCGNDYFLDFERNATFTLSAWVKTTSTGKVILSKMNVSENYRGYDLFIHSTGVIRAHLINELDSNEIIVDGSTAINDNLWHFVILTYNGSSSASGVKLYIDGSLENLTIVEDTLNATLHTDVNFLIGARTSGNYFSGQVDDVRVYSFELTQDNITWLNNSGNGRPSKTLDGEDIAEVSIQYNLEIPYVGVVYDANLTLAIKSEGIPLGTGNITIEIVKEEINCSIINVILSSSFNEFNNTSQFSYEKFIDITSYVNNNSITEYYGKYLLNIEIHGTDYRDKFVIPEFYLQTDTYIEVAPTDIEGWITNPGLDDTDGDGWNDYKEIFLEGTNPLSADTDGDSVWDKFDRDPLQDVMLKISPILGTIWFPKTRKLEIVISFKLEGTGESFSIYTQRHWTTVQGEQSVDWLYETWYEWTAYFDGTHESPDALHYYVNIDDDIRVQGNQLEFKLQLWRINKHWDNKHLSGYDTYTINDVGHSEIVNVTSIEEIESVPMKTEAKINVTTIGVEKANTIAIYETNGTTYNGHYQEQERMNILQLYVNDSGAGTPFVEGPNVIVIPTRLFTETVFNAYVQNETLSETPIYSADEEIFMFISVGRDGNTEQACEEIDFIFIRFDISSEDAMEVLTLLLTCLVNETTNETAIVYSYVSTKLNETTAVMMNFPFSVLGFIPWFCNFTESPMGSKPETKDDVFWKPLKTLGRAIVGVLLFIGMAIVTFVELIIDFVAEILMEWLPILEYILWLIIRVIILIIAWIEFAFNLLMMIILVTIIASFMYILSIFVNIDISIKIDKVIVNGLFTLTFGYKISFEHINFLDLDLPIFIGYLNSSDFAFEYSAGLFSMDLFFSKFSDNAFDRLDDDPKQSTEESPKMSTDLTNNNENVKLIRKCKTIEAIGITMGLSANTIGLLASIAAFKKDKSTRVVYIIASIAFVISLGVLIANTILFSGEFTPWVVWGLGLGLIITGGLCFATGTYLMLTKYAFMSKFEKYLGKEALYSMLGILDTQLALWGAGLDLKNLFDSEDLENPLVENPISRATISLTTGILSLILAQQALIFLGGKYNTDNFGRSIYLDRQEKTIITLVFSGIFLTFGITLFTLSYFLD